MRYLILSLLLFLFVSLLSLRLQCQEMIRGDILNEDKMLWCIKKAEGNKYYYGIKDCGGEIACRKICLNTIRHLYKKFTQIHGHGIRNFIKYCSTNYVSRYDRTGQQNWNKNVLWLYYKGVDNDTKKSIK